MKFYINKFKEIAAKENGTFYFSDSDIGIGGGVRSPHVILQLRIPYKDYEIFINNKTGTSFVGTYSCTLPLALKAPDFTIQTRNHLSTLFSRNKKNRFKITTEQEKLNEFLKKSSSLNALNTIAKDTIFEPYIYGKNSETDYQFKIEYHLQFNNWTQVLEPLITFNKEIIDALENRSYTLH
ncbi:hypothetical protein [Dokdonia sp.]|uniref:hypothetical protein n=1 Tax=Dokdonia sp. TaxID=2024995 RepID=UPI003266A4DB